LSHVRVSLSVTPRPARKPDTHFLSEGVIISSAALSCKRRVRNSPDQASRGATPPHAWSADNSRGPVYIHRGDIPCPQDLTVSTSEPRIHIIGVGSDGLAGLTSHARDLLLSADVIFGSEPILKLLPELRAERRVIGADWQEIVNALTALV